MDELPDIRPTNAELFKPEDLENGERIGRAAKTFLHTGKIVTKDEERAAEIALCYLANQSFAGTARLCRCSPNTVRVVVTELEAAGKLDDLKQRLSRRLGLLAAMSCDAALEKVAAGTMPANVLPILMGVALDKKAQLDGEPTTVTEVRHTRDVNVDEALAYLRSHGIKAPIDIESTAVATISPQKTALPEPSSTASDTPTPPPG